MWIDSNRVLLYACTGIICVYSMRMDIERNGMFSDTNGEIQRKLY